MSELRLGVNIDHAATLRQARYSGVHTSPLAEPDILRVAEACKEGGAHSLTVHLREDRRHVQESDIRLLKSAALLPLNLEMAAEDFIADFAIEIRPDDVCIVPERRSEVTTEGGLNVRAKSDVLRPLIARLKKAGIRVSLFIDPDPAQVAASSDLGVDAVELHTGAFSNVCLPGGPMRAGASAELKRLIAAAERAADAGLQVNAGHGINYFNIKQILEIPRLSDLNIGHSIICRGLLVGMRAAVAEMLAAMRGYSLSGSAKEHGGS